MIVPWTHQELVKIAAKWALGRHGIVFCERRAMTETPDVMAFHSRYSTLIECKVTRSDFLRDRHKAARRIEELCMGNYRIYCVPKGMIGEDEIPESWGLLEVYPSGRARLRTNIYTHRQGAIWWNKLSERAARSERNMLYSRLIAIRDGYLTEISDGSSRVARDDRRR